MKKIAQSVTRIWKVIAAEVATWFERTNPDTQTWTWNIDDQRFALQVLAKEDIKSFHPSDFDAVWNGEGKEPQWTRDRLKETIKDYEAAMAALAGAFHA